MNSKKCSTLSIFNFLWICLVLVGSNSPSDWFLIFRAWFISYKEQLYLAIRYSLVYLPWFWSERITRLKYKKNDKTLVFICINIVIREYLDYIFLLYIYIYILYVCLNNIVKRYSCKDLSDTYDVRKYYNFLMIEVVEHLHHTSI